MALVDRDALRHNDTLSGVVEQWLLRDGERADEEAMSKGLSRAARRVS